MVATRLCLFSLLSLLSALRTPSRSQIPRTVLHSRRGILGGVLAGVTSLSVTGRIPESRADSTGGIAESRLVRSLSDLQKLDGSIVAHQYRQAREELREGALAHLREDVREAMAYHPVSEAKAKATIDALVNLDNVLRRAEVRLNPTYKSAQSLTLTFIPHA
ncbi:hypothetical protein AAMO2058_000282900 [Amorphochlora amoebiformis]